MSKKFEFQKLPGEPIVVFTAFEDYHMAADAEMSVRATFEVFDALDEPVSYILNWENIKPLDFEDVSVGAMAVALSQNPVFKHPNIQEIIFVTTSEILAMAARGLNSEIYGYIKIEVFTTMDKALRFVRS